MKSWLDLDVPIDSSGLSVGPPSHVPSPVPQGVDSSTAITRPDPRNVIQSPSGSKLVEIQEKKQEEMFERVLQELGEQAALVLGDTFAFRDITPDQDVPPAEWNLTPREGAKRLAVARAGWLPPKDAPSGVSVARSFAVGFMKSEAAKKGGSRTLNVQVVQMVQQEEEQSYEEVEVERERK